MNQRQKFFLGGMLCLITFPLFAQEKKEQEPNVITTAVPTLLIAPDSRAGGMGDIGAASSPDANSQHHNPAKYIFCEDRVGFSLSYSRWLSKLASDINLAYLAGYYKITDNDAVSISLRYFNLGKIMFTDVNGSDLGEFNPNEFALDAGYTRKFIKTLSMSIVGRFIYSDLAQGQFVNGEESKAGMSGAADLALYYNDDFKVRGLKNSHLAFGFNISNIGAKMSYTQGSTDRDFLPTNLKIGLAYTLEFDEYNKLSFLGEINKLLVPTPPIYYKDSFDVQGNRVIESGKSNDVSVFMGMIQSFYDAPYGFKEEMQEYNWALALEYSYRNLLSVRTGYFNESKYKGARKFFTFGVGLRYSIFALDVSYLLSVAQHHPLENTLRFTLSFDFKADKNKTSKDNKIKTASKASKG